jgi:hypothetical protein
MGRFMSPDPLGLTYASVANPQSFNLYAHALNNLLRKPGGPACVWGDGNYRANDDSRMG